uniref:Uncharacterized protein n=1 Tax=Anguilla anguilla TaxID=7936 RepID=A0A0E9QIK5_ANGAN
MDGWMDLMKDGDALVYPGPGIAGM